MGRGFAPNRDAGSEAQAIQWIFGVLGEPVPQGSFEEVLRDGNALCRFMAKIRPDLMSKFKPSDQPAKQRENIGLFTQACTAVGVPGTDLFQTIDLQELKDPAAVANCLSRLGGVVHPKKKVLESCRNRREVGKVLNFGSSHIAFYAEVLCTGPRRLSFPLRGRAYYALEKSCIREAQPSASPAQVFQIRFSAKLQRKGQYPDFEKFQHLLHFPFTSENAKIYTFGMLFQKNPEPDCNLNWPLMRRMLLMELSKYQSVQMAFSDYHISSQIINAQSFSEAIFRNRMCIKLAAMT